MPGTILYHAKSRCKPAFVFMDASPPTPFVELRNVTFGYGDRAVLDGLSVADLVAPLPVGKGDTKAAGQPVRWVPGLP